MQISYKRKPHIVKKKLIELLIAVPLKILPLRNIIIFESHPDFCDNSKTLFSKMIEHKINEKYKFFWLVKDINRFKDINIFNVKFVSIKRDTIFEKIISELRNTILIVQCKYFFFSHINFARLNPRKGQIYFNLTHGQSLKDTTGKTTNYKKSSYILSISDFAGSLRVKTYQGGDSKIKVLGFPRNDLLIGNTDSFKRLGIYKESYSKIIIWMPTFRRHKNAKRNDTGTKEISDLPVFKKYDEIIKLSDYLKKQNALVIIKPHPAQDMKFMKDIVAENIKMITNKMLLDSEVELYEILGESDALITDYSSVYIDYLITNKPIGFTIDDIKAYQNVSGFLVQNPLNYMPGIKITKPDDMIEFIKSIIREHDEYKSNRERIRETFHKYIDNKSSERIIDFLKLID